MLYHPKRGGGEGGDYSRTEITAELRSWGCGGGTTKIKLNQVPESPAITMYQ